MSTVGYYRYKKTFSADEAVSLYINDALVSSKNVVIKAFCDGGKRLKFLNRNGQYRFVGFNKFFEGTEAPQDIGQVNKIFSSIYNAQTNRDNIGKRNERTFTLVSEIVRQEELDIIKDMWTSPRVYLYVGDGTTDNNRDWVQVTLENPNPIINIRQGDYVDVTVQITLPEFYTINMI